MHLRDMVGLLYKDTDFAALFPTRGQLADRVCEKSGRAGSGNKEAEGRGGAGAKVLPEGGNLRGAGTADEGEHEIAAGGHDLGGRTAAQVRAILAESHVTQPVAALDAPVAANEREQAVGVGVAGGKAGDEIDGFCRHFLRRADGADEAGDLGDAREGDIGAQVVVEAGARAEGACVSAAPAAINRLGGTHGGARIGKIGDQCGAQTGLVVLDGEEVGAAMIEDARGQGGLGMQGVGGDDAPAQGEMGQELLGHGDLVGFVADAHLHQRFLGGVRRDGEHLGRRLRPRAGATHDLAIEREGSRSRTGRVCCTQHANARSICATDRRGSSRR